MQRIAEGDKLCVVPCPTSVMLEVAHGSPDFWELCCLETATSREPVLYDLTVGDEESSDEELLHYLLVIREAAAKVLGDLKGDACVSAAALAELGDCCCDVVACTEGLVLPEVQLLQAEHRRTKQLCMDEHLEPMTIDVLLDEL